MLLIMNGMIILLTRRTIRNMDDNIIINKKRYQGLANTVQSVVVKGVSLVMVHGQQMHRSTQGLSIYLTLVECSGI